MARAQLVKQGVFHYTGQLAPVLSSIVLVPFMLGHLGVEAYGFWIVALAAPGFAVGLDNALYVSIAREAAAHRGLSRISESETGRFLSACCGAYVALGVLCVLWIGGTGVFLVRHLHLSAELRTTAPIVFGSVAIGFVAGRATAFANAVLAGFQRFGTMNAISVGVLAGRFVGFVALLTYHYSLGAIAVWYMTTGVVESVVALGFAHRLGAVHFDRSLVEWRRLRQVGSFGVSSFLTTVVQNIWWFSPPMIVGLMAGGAGATAALYTGQRPCFIVSELNWRGAEVLFSASAGADEPNAEDRHSELLIFGTKCLLAVAMPLCIGLYLLAPALLSVWLNVPPSGTERIMRITALGVIADALWVGPLHVLWGRGRARAVLMITSVVTGLGLLLTVVSVAHMGTPGAAWAFAISSWVGAIVTLIVAARETATSWLKFLLGTVGEVAIPSAAMVVFVLGATLAIRGNPLVFLLLGALGGGTLYAIIFLLQQRIQGHSVSGFAQAFRRT